MKNALHLFACFLVCLPANPQMQDVTNVCTSECPNGKATVCLSNLTQTVRLIICWRVCPTSVDCTVEVYYIDKHGNREVVFSDNAPTGAYRFLNYYNSTIELCFGRDYIVEVTTKKFSNPLKTELNKTISLFTTEKLPPPNLTAVTNIGETNNQFFIEFQLPSTNILSKCDEPLYLITLPDTKSENISVAVGWNSTTNVYFGLVDFNNEVNSLRVYYEAKSGRISELSDISYTSLPTVTISNTVATMVVSDGTIALLSVGTSIVVILMIVIVTVCFSTKLYQKRRREANIKVTVDVAVETDIISIQPDVATICEDAGVVVQKGFSSPPCFHSPTSQSGVYVALGTSQPESGLNNHIITGSLQSESVHHETCIIPI